MILETHIEMPIISFKTRKYFRDKGYVAEMNTTILVKVTDLNKFSRVRITGICECGTKIKLSFNKYMTNFSRHNFYSCKKFFNKKRILFSQAKWQVDNYMQTQEAKDLIAKNNIEKYGVKTTLLVPEVKAKIDATNLANLGTVDPLSSPIIREKGRKTMLEKYNVDSYNQTQEFSDRMKVNNINKLELKLVDQKIDFNFIDDITGEMNCTCDKCGNDYDISYKLYEQRVSLYKSPTCLICNPLNSRKGGEYYIYDFIKTHYIDIIELDRNDLLPPTRKEIDVYLPDLKLGFEYNGVYYHSDAVYKPENYHQNKSNLAHMNDIQLIHVWEDDWIYKQEIVKSIILEKLNIFTTTINSSKCYVDFISDDVANEFNTHNHISPKSLKDNINIGLFYEETLVYLMSFKSHNNDEYTIINISHLLNTNIINGFSELFNFFFNMFNPSKISTSVDISYYNGNILLENGFKYIKTLPPEYMYVDRNKRVKIDVGDMYKIYDAGRIEYTYNNPNF